MKNIGAIILAAGEGKRFGAIKQLLEISGETLLDRSCRVAFESGYKPIIRVLGAKAEEIINHTSFTHSITVINPRWSSGMGNSIAYGVRALLRFSPDCDGVIILLSDQPSITPSMLEELYKGYQEDGKTIALSDMGESSGPPAIFDRCHFGALTYLSGSKGAKRIADSHPGQVALVPLPLGAWDIDTPEQWAEFINPVNKPMDLRLQTGE